MVRDSFTGKEIPPGTGLMYVKKDGTIYYFADKKSEKNLLKLKRKPTKTRWTEKFHTEKEKIKRKLSAAQEKISPSRNIEKAVAKKKGKN